MQGSLHPDALDQIIDNTKIFLQKRGGVSLEGKTLTRDEHGRIFSANC